MRDWRVIFRDSYAFHNIMILPSEDESGKGFASQNKKEMGQRVALPKAPGWMKKILGGSFDKNGITDQGDAFSDPIDPTLAKTSMMHDIKKEWPFHGVKSFCHVNFDCHIVQVALPFFHIVKTFPNQNGVILDKTTREKGRLTWGDDAGENRFKSIGKNLGNNFITNIWKTNWPKLMHIIRILNFWDQSQVGVIEFFEEFTVNKEILNDSN